MAINKIGPDEEKKTSLSLKRRQDAVLFLYSNGNLLGSVLAIAGLVLHFTGLIGVWWLPIVIGLYLLGVLVAPKSPEVDLSIRNQLTADDIRMELDELTRKIHNRVSDEIFNKVTSIKNSILQVLPDISDLSSGDYSIFTIKKTALDYLPATLENYLRLPPVYASLHPVQNGKTPKDLLLQQLAILDEEMKKVVSSVYHNDTQALMSQGRFLEEKFSEPLELK